MPEVHENQAEEGSDGCISEVETLNRQLSDYLLSMEMFGLLIGLRDEEDVIDTVIELGSMLFSPEQIVYAQVRDRKIVSVSKLKAHHNTVSPVDLPAGTDISKIKYDSYANGFTFPFEVWGEIVGYFSVECEELPQDVEKHRNIARILSPLCGLVVTNARNYNRLETAIKERDEEIERRKVAEKDLSAAIKKLSLLSGITRHDILNHIMVANYHLETLTEDSPELEERLKPVTKSISEIQRQIEFTRDYQDMGVTPPSWQESVRLIRNCFSERDYPKSITVDLKLPSVEIYADPMLQKAFCNVISNAYNHAEGMTHLEISGRQTGESFTIRIADNGAGVPDDKKDLIFRPGHGKNHGYGLFLVSEIFGLTDISIKENGIFGEGAVFEIEIPAGVWKRPADISE